MRGENPAPGGHRSGREIIMKKFFSGNPMVIFLGVCLAVIVICIAGQSQQAILQQALL